MRWGWRITGKKNIQSLSIQRFASACTHAYCHRRLAVPYYYYTANARRSWRHTMTVSHALSSAAAYKGNCSALQTLHACCCCRRALTRSERRYNKNANARTSHCMQKGARRLLGDRYRLRWALTFYVRWALISIQFKFVYCTQKQQYFIKINTLVQKSQKKQCFYMHMCLCAYVLMCLCAYVHMCLYVLIFSTRWILFKIN